MSRLKLRIMCNVHFHLVVAISMGKSMTTGTGRPEATQIEIRFRKLFVVVGDEGGSGIAVKQ